MPIPHRGNSSPATSPDTTGRSALLRTRSYHAGERPGAEQRAHAYRRSHAARRHADHAPGQPADSAGQSPLRNVAAMAPMDQNVFLRMTTPVRTSITAATTDDVHTTLQLVDTRAGRRFDRRGNAGKSGVFGLQLHAHADAAAPDGGGRQRHGLCDHALRPERDSDHVDQRHRPCPRSRASKRGDQCQYRHGGASRPARFVTITGTNLASTATATSLPPPTVLGGSCVLVDDVAIPLLSTSPTQIQAQIPANICRARTCCKVRSLDNAQRSAPVVVISPGRGSNMRKAIILRAGRVCGACRDIWKGDAAGRRRVRYRARRSAQPTLSDRASPNQVQVYSIKQAKFLAPIATDQTPLSAALGRDGNTLYVVCYDSADARRDQSRIRSRCTSR